MRVARRRSKQQSREPSDWPRWRYGRERAAGRRARVDELVCRRVRSRPPAGLARPDRRWRAWPRRLSGRREGPPAAAGRHARDDDIEAVHDITGIRDSEDPSRALETFAGTTTATSVAERAQLVGVPAAVLGASAVSEVGDPVRELPIGSPGATSGTAPVVVDLSSLWAGPLCSHLLGQAGAHVIKVESAHRPDGARGGNQAFWTWLHAHDREARVVDFRSEAGRAELRAIVERADVVIEASRP